MGKWDGGYLTITNVRFHEETLIVQFDNGDNAPVPKSTIDERGTQGIRWEEVHIDSAKNAIIIPTDFTVPFWCGSIEPDLNKFIIVPAFEIRKITDELYGKHIEEMRIKQLQHFGNRVKELRKKAGLSREAVVRICNLVPEELKKIEEGNFNLAHAPLIRILEAIGYSMSELYN